MVIIIIITYLIIGIIEIIPLIKKKMKKELIIYSVTFITAFVLSILLSLGVKIPSPAKPIENVIKLFIDIK